MRWDNLVISHELYCIGHLIQAGVAHRRGDRRRRTVRRRPRAADCVVRDFGERRRKDTDGHPEIEMALVELYRETGEPRYLDLARQLLDVRGHGVLDARTALRLGLLPGRHAGTRADHRVGHAVRALYLLCGVVDVYLETGEQALLESALRPVDVDDGDQDVPHRRGRLPLRGRVVRRGVRAAAGPRLRRDLRDDRRRHASLAAAAGHRRGPLRRRDRAGVSTTCSPRRRRSSARLLLQQPGPAADRTGPPPRSSRPPGRGAGHPAAVVRVRLLPAEHHADDRLARRLRRHARDAGVQIHQYMPATIRPAPSGGWPMDTRVPAGRRGHGERQGEPAEAVDARAAGARLAGAGRRRSVNGSRWRRRGSTGTCATIAHGRPATSSPTRCRCRPG